MQAVILAGGLGTRLKPFTDNMPKPMMPILGKPFLEYLINQLKSAEIEDILILLGYLPEKVVDYFGSGEKWGVRITYDITPVDFDTGARIDAAKDKLENTFLLMYCDNFCPIDIKRAMKQFESSQAEVQITAYSNRFHYTKNNLIVEKNNQVSLYDKKRQSENLNAVDIGYAFVKKNVLSSLVSENVNFEQCIYPKLAEKGKLYVYMTEHRYVSIGSYERVDSANLFFQPRKVIFLDRDGTVNRRAQPACYIEKVEDFEWLPGAKEAIKKLNDNNYLVILITNQPGIARGVMTEEALESIHRKMEADLLEVDARIDRIYCCMHGWNDDCFCRKPKPGMLYMAQHDLNFDLTKAVLIGDDDRDIEAAEAAEVRGIKVDDEYMLLDAVDELLNQI